MPSNPPRTYLLTCEDPLYSVAVVKELRKVLGPNLVGVAFVSGLFNWRRVVLGPLYYGPFNYIFLIIRVLYDGFRGGKIQSFLSKEGIPLDQFTSVRNGKLRKRLKELDVELLISLNCNKKLREPLISLPKYGTINLHNSKLPAYGGLMPIFHALARNESEIGVTVHRIDGEIDTGPILRQEMIPVGRFDTYFSLWKKAVAVGARILPEVALSLPSGGLQTKPNGPKGRSYFSLPTISEACTYWSMLLRRFLFGTKRRQ